MTMLTEVADSNLGVDKLLAALIEGVLGRRGAGLRRRQPRLGVRRLRQGVVALAARGAEERRRSAALCCFGRSKAGVVDARGDGRGRVGAWRCVSPDMMCPRAPSRG